MGDLRYQNFTELDIWKNSRALKNELFDVVKTFPPCEKFRLADQIIRSARSINSNIAEGHGRFTYKDQIHFCIQARGSLSETSNHLFDALDCNYISKNKFEDFSEKIEIIRRLLSGYISFMRSKIQND
jgi:four helix bundle protein